MDKSELPSATYLAKLREEGIFPTSTLLVRSVSAIFVISSVLVLLSAVYGFDALFKIESLEEVNNRLVKFVFTLGIIPLVAALVAAFLIGFFQTRFKLQAVVKPKRKNERAAFLSLIVSGIAAGAVVTFFSIRMLLLLFIEPLPLLPKIALQALERPLFVALGILVFVTFAAFLVSRLSFLLAHRMRADQKDESDDARVTRVW